MINFYNSSFHSILGIADSDERRHPPNWWDHILSPADCSGLHLLATDSSISHFDVENPMAREKPSDPGSWGLHEACVDGGRLSLCTENLGSESCDSGIEIDVCNESALGIEKQHALRPTRRRKEKIRFPPPLSWMSGPGGRRTQFLKAERLNGRLVLTKFQINRSPDILRAIRIDGRLRLELIRTKLDGDEEAIYFIEEKEKLPESGYSVDGEVVDENDERWELLRVRNEGQRCVKAVNGDGEMPKWWIHRFLTTT